MEVHSFGRRLFASSSALSATAMMIRPSVLSGKCSTTIGDSISPRSLGPINGATSPTTSAPSARRWVEERLPLVRGSPASCSAKRTGTVSAVPTRFATPARLNRRRIASALGRHAAASAVSTSINNSATTVGTVSLCIWMGTGSCCTLTRNSSTDMSCRPRGSDPASISYKTTATAYRSAAGLVLCSPLSTSGAMYGGVPPPRSRACVIVSANPKSSMRTRAPDLHSMMFAGFTSACTTPFRWISDKPSSNPSPMSIDSSTPRDPSLRSRSRRV